jgi:hypothetical protein
MNKDIAERKSIHFSNNVISGCFSLPRISIPVDAIETADGKLSFSMATHGGIIEVSSAGYNDRSRWNCRGTASALEAGGLIRSDWCPGLPGNNKSRQTVLFKSEGPRLILGNRRSTHISAPHIVIARVSTNKFVVEVAATKEQYDPITQAWDRGNQRWLDELQHQQKNKEQMENKREGREIQRVQTSPFSF